MMIAIRSAIAPLLSIALLMLGNGFFTTFISLHLFEQGHDATTIGFVQAAYYGGFLLGAAKIEGLIRRIRHIRAYAFFACIATALTLFQGIFVHPMIWVVERFIVGLCIASLYVVIESWLLIIAPDGARGKLLAAYMIALYAAQGISQFFVTWLDIQSLTPYLVAGILCSLSVFPVTFTYTQVPDLPPPEGKNFFHILKKAPFGAFGCIIAGMILSGIYSFLPTYAEEVKISVSLVMSVCIAGGFFLQWPLGYLSDIFDRRRVLLYVSLAILIPCILLITLQPALLRVLFLVFFLGGLCFTVYPLSISYVSDRFEAKDLTAVTAVLLFAYSIGSVLGPLVAPFLIDALMPYGLFIFLGIMAGILSIVGCYSLIRYRPVPLKKQGDFVPLPGQSTLSYELDPRSNPEKENSEESDEEPDSE